MFAVEKNIAMDSILMKKAYMKTVCDLAADERVYTLDADLLLALGDEFREAYPNRAIDVGIAEANMVGIAGGLSAAGKIPYVHTFAPFLSRRAFDQTYIAIGYAKQNAKFIASDPGIFAEHNGGTHTEFSDMSIMRGVPDATVIEPADRVALESVVRSLKDAYGFAYVRMPRCAVEKIYTDSSQMEIGKGNVLREGKDVTIIASGYMLARALYAADTLAQWGISARVVDMFTWKPIDKELIERCARETGAIVTAENHHVLTGLGSAVASVLAECCPTPIEFVGVGDAVGQVGTLAELAEAFGLTEERIIAKAKRAVARK